MARGVLFLRKLARRRNLRQTATELREKKKRKKTERKEAGLSPVEGALKAAISTPLKDDHNALQQALDGLKNVTDEASSSPNSSTDSEELAKPDLLSDIDPKNCNPQTECPLFQKLPVKIRLKICNFVFVQYPRISRAYPKEEVSTDSAVRHQSAFIPDSSIPAVVLSMRPDTSH